MKTTTIKRIRASAKILLLLAIFGLFWQCTNPIGKTKDQKVDLTPTSDTAMETYRTQGKLIVQKSFETLSGQLMQAINEGGIPYALSYCNLNALALTDSLSVAYHADIKRVSLKPRNTVNRADSFETSLINTFDKLAVGNLTGVNMVVRDNDGAPVFAAPIVMGKLCLQCHGEKGKDIEDSNLKLIERTYPEDQATGYREGELRGIWRIKFLKND